MTDLNIMRIITSAEYKCCRCKKPIKTGTEVVIVNDRTHFHGDCWDKDPQLKSKRKKENNGTI